MLRGKKHKKKVQQESRRPYRKPHLQPYGSVKDLTAGGTGTKIEAHPHPLGKDRPARKSRAWSDAEHWESGLLIAVFLLRELHLHIFTFSDFHVFIFLRRYYPFQHVSHGWSSDSHKRRKISCFFVQSYKHATGRTGRLCLDPPLAYGLRRNLSFAGKTC